MIDKLCDVCSQPMPGAHGRQLRHPKCRNVCDRLCKKCGQPGLGPWRKYHDECQPEVIGGERFRRCQHFGCTTELRRARGRRYCDEHREQHAKMSRNTRRGELRKLEQARVAHVHVKPDGDFTLQAVADIYAMSRERVRQVEAQALKRFERHWHILIELCAQADLTVDWDWLFGRKRFSSVDYSLD